MKTKLLLFISLCITGLLFAQVPEPVAHFPFDTDFADAKGLFTATNMGAVELVTDSETGETVAYFPGGAKEDPDSLNYISIDPGIFNNYDAVTYSCWYKIEVNSDWQRIFTAATEEPDGQNYEFFITPSNNRHDDHLTVTVEAGGGGSGVEVPSIEPLEAETWYMITAAINGTNIKLWLDGVVQADSLQDVGAPSTGNVPSVMIGKAGWPDPMLNGWMEDFKVFDSFLTDAQVTALYDAGIDYTGIKNTKNTFNLNIIAEKNQIIIQNPANTRINSVQIYNMTGSLVYQTNEFHEIINHNLQPSLYMIKVESNLGDYITKIITK